MCAVIGGKPAGGAGAIPTSAPDIAASYAGDVTDTPGITAASATGIEGLKKKKANRSLQQGILATVATPLGGGGAVPLGIPQATSAGAAVGVKTKLGQ